MSIETLAADTQAEHPGSTPIDIAGLKVPVLKGGLYDRYRSNPPLSTISTEAPDIDLSWFQQLRKERVDIGFESYSPNFYYRNRRVTAIFTADLTKLTELMPGKVLERVRPLQIWPGRGLVALTAYSYDYCDNDSYNEIGLSIVTSKPGSPSLGPISLMAQSMANDFWGYVLKLPVNTELARVRGVVGYNLSKWVTRIDYRESEDMVAVSIFDGETQKLDLTLDTRKLSGLSSMPTLVTNNFTNLDARGRLTSGYAVSRDLKHAATSKAELVRLSLGDGSLSTFISSLKLGRLVKYEYVPEFQSALYVPKAIS